MRNAQIVIDAVAALVLAKDLESPLLQVADDADRHQHAVGVLPTTDIGGGELGFEVEEDGILRVGWDLGFGRSVRPSIIGRHGGRPLHIIGRPLHFVGRTVCLLG